MILCSAAERYHGGGAPPRGSQRQGLQVEHRLLGAQIYTDYAYPFEIAAMILLVAIIAAIALTHRKRRATKYQNPSEQVRVRRNDRLRIIDMPVEKPDGTSHQKPAPAPAAGEGRTWRTGIAANAGALPGSRGDAVRHQRGGDFSQPAQCAHHPDGDRIDAARRQPQLHRLLAFPGRRQGRYSCSSSSPLPRQSRRSGLPSWCCCSATSARSTSRNSIS